MSAARAMHWAGLAWALTMVVGEASAAADEAKQGPAYKLSLDLDATILATAGGVAAGFLVVSEGTPPSCAPECKKSSVNALDRKFAGRYDPTWGTVGNIATFATMFAGPIALVAAEGFSDGLNDTVVVGEAALVTSALQVTVSYATQRPRPRVYGTKAPLEDRNDANAGRSFFSGHVANGVAATLATTRALLRTDHPVLAWTMFGIGTVGSAVIGAGRIGAGSHFPTDVFMGALVGAGIGIGIPALHASGRVPVQAVPVVTDSSAYLSLSGKF